MGSTLNADRLLSRCQEIRETIEPHATVAFSIGSTPDFIEGGLYYTTPLRRLPGFSLWGVVVADVETGVKLARVVEPLVDCIFVDCEKKISPENYGTSDVGNLDKAVRREIQMTPVLTYKGNDITVDAIEHLCVRALGEVSGHEVAVVGVGNIGSKAALRLVERGNHVRLFSRDYTKVEVVVEAINRIRPSGTISRAQAARGLPECLQGVRVVIGSATSKQIIGLAELEFLGCAPDEMLLVDVGKGVFGEDVLSSDSFIVHRLDAGEQMLSVLNQKWIDWNKQDSKEQVSPQRSVMRGLRLARRGIAGAKGDVIVDDVQSPTVVYGVCDGSGGFDVSATDAALVALGLRPEKHGPTPSA